MSGRFGRDGSAAFEGFAVMTITLSLWMVPFLAIPIVMFASMLINDGEITRNDFGAIAAVTAIAWFFMGLARFLP